MQLNLKNKTALITGASQGIGKEIAMQLAKEGVQVVITSNDEKNLHQVVEEIRAQRGSVIAIPGDVTLQNELENIINKTINHFNHIDILVNNVGSVGRVASFEDFTAEEWIHVFKLNIMSGVTLSRLLIPYMKKNLWGRIIFISSEKATEPGLYLSPYSMTKAAILSVAKSLANECGKDGITVNCISPGVILTPSWDADAEKANMSRGKYASQFCQNIVSREQLGMPDDVATLACYLCSNLARWITGSNFRVDGGSLKNIQI